MKDISSKKDVENLVDLFYGKVLKDVLLAPFFASLNFDQHKPKMIHFWSFVLLDESNYTTDVTQKHLHMRLKKEHFERWIFLFNSTIDEHFAGPKADAAKERAYQVGWVIQSKINPQNH